MATGGPKPNRSIERAIDVMAALAAADEPMSVVDLEQTLSLSRPTLYRILHTLGKKGVVACNGEPQRFSVGARTVELARPWIGNNDLTAAAQPALRALWEQTGETVALFALGDAVSKVCIEELQSRHALVFTRGAGFVEPLTVGSSGKSILAFLDPASIDGIVGNERERDRIERDLAAIRRDGFSITEGEIIAGAVAMAAPIFDRSGAVKGSVSLYGPDSRLTGGHRSACLDQLLASARRVSAALGYRHVSAAE